MKTIYTPRLTIRPFQPGDAEAFHAYRSDPVLATYQSYSPLTRAQAREIIASMQGRVFGHAGEWVQVAILLRQAEHHWVLVGDMGLKPDMYDKRIVEMGITVGASHQNQGIAKEAIRAVVTELFIHYRIHRVVAHIDVENTASVAVFEAVGFRREGHTLQSFCNKGVWRDEYIYAVLQAEWPTPTP